MPRKSRAGVRKPHNRKTGAGAGRAGKFPISYTADDLRESVSRGLSAGGAFENQIAGVLAELGILPEADRALLEAHGVKFAVETKPGTAGTYDFLHKKISLSAEVLYDLSDPKTPANLLAESKRTVRHEVGHAMDSFYAIQRGGKPVESGKSMSSSDYLSSYSPAFQSAIAKDLAANRNPLYISENKYYTAPNATRTQSGDHFREMFAQTYSVITSTQPGAYEKQWAETFPATTAALRSMLKP